MDITFWLQLFVPRPGRVSEDRHGRCRPPLSLSTRAHTLLTKQPRSLQRCRPNHRFEPFATLNSILGEPDFFSPLSTFVTEQDHVLGKTYSNCSLDSPRLTNPRKNQPRVFWDIFDADIKGRSMGWITGGDGLDFINWALAPHVVHWSMYNTSFPLPTARASRIQTQDGR